MNMLLKEWVVSYQILKWLTSYWSSNLEMTYLLLGSRILMVGVPKKKKEVSFSYIIAIKDVYDGTVDSVRTTCGNTSKFSIVIG